MSPLVTVFVIMLLTVVYNESQFVADYEDAYQKILTKNNGVPFDLCDLALKSKMCRKSNMWREFLKKTDYLHDDLQDFSREYAHDYFEDEDVKTQNVKIGQKRNYPHKIVSQDIYNCATVKTHVDLGEGYYPRIIGNITCEHTSNESIKICSRGWNCQPVEYSARVLSRHKLSDNTIPNDIPQDLKGCWLFEEILIHVGCKCGRSF